LSSAAFRRNAVCPFLLLVLTACESYSPQPAERIAQPEVFIDTLSGPDNQQNRFLISDAIQVKINRYENIVRRNAKKYGFDWRLIMAQIRQESRFMEQARSRVGARGLMQIMPGTARELHNELDIENITRKPEANIAAGVYHLYKQYRDLDDVQDADERLKMALAAYNAGMGRVRDARDYARVLFADDQHWQAVARALPRLAKSFWQNHLEVWPSGIPPHGYFNGSDETVGYVKSIMGFYEIYKQYY
jgi:membrane-bound lytic murein transglycosylase F